MNKSINIDKKNNKWEKIEDDEKWHWFKKVNSNEKYLKDFKGLNEIFENIGNGIETQKDSLTIQINKDQINDIINNFRLLNYIDIIDKYDIKEGRDWQVSKAKEDIISNNGKIEIIHYRPFDFRYTYYSGKSKGFIAYPRYNTMKNFIDKENIGLVFPFQIAGAYGFEHGLVSSYIIDRANGGAKTGSETYFAPLYLYEDICTETDLNFDDEVKPNFTEEFFKFLKTYFNGALIKNEDYPLKILSYIYAVIYSPTYRSRYKSDLKYSCPRIPFTDNIDLFNSLSSLGASLIDLHLLKKVPEAKSSYPIKGDNSINYCKFDDNKIRINDTQYFNNISPEVYNYSIGGYKPIEKYIKARNMLSSNDIIHLQKVIAVIDATIDMQIKIDEVYKGIDK